METATGWTTHGLLVVVRRARLKPVLYLHPCCGADEDPLHPALIRASRHCSLIWRKVSRASCGACRAFARSVCVFLQESRRAFLVDDF